MYVMTYSVDVILHSDYLKQSYTGSIVNIALEFEMYDEPDASHSKDLHPVKLYLENLAFEIKSPEFWKDLDFTPHPASLARFFYDFSKQVIEFNKCIVTVGGCRAEYYEEKPVWQ